MEKLEVTNQKIITMITKINGVYVDGISITSGNPRNHVWTYAVGLSDDGNNTHANYPCAKTRPSYVCWQSLLL